MNQFADLENEEFMATYMSYKSSSTRKLEKFNSFQYEKFTALPPSIDWRKKGAVTSIRNETCGKFSILTKN